jgi:hypothetical protein
MKKREQILHRLDTYERTMLWNSLGHTIGQYLRYNLMNEITNRGFGWQYKAFSVLRAGIKNEEA